MTKEELQHILDQHKLWLAGKGGARADLLGVNLRNADLLGVNLRNADLCGADLRHANLCGADLCGAKLRGANLTGTDLCGANLRGANLHYAVGNMEEVKSMQIERWHVVYTHDMLFIGCQGHKIEDWYSFSDKEISIMDIHALEWWHKWRNVLSNIIELSPAAAPEVTK